MSLERRTADGAPLKRRVQSSARGWERQERRVAAALPGGKRTPGSGASSAPQKKGDVLARFCRVECKTTLADSLRLERGWLDGIASQADATRKLPVLAFGFDGAFREDWLALRLADARILFHIADAVRRGAHDEADEWTRRLPR